MKNGYVCNCSKCRKRRENLRIKEVSQVNGCLQNTSIMEQKKRRPCCQKEVKHNCSCCNVNNCNVNKCNCKNNCNINNCNCNCNCKSNCNCKNKCCINPLFWVFALFLI